MNNTTSLGCGCGCLGIVIGMIVAGIVLLIGQGAPIAIGAFLVTVGGMTLIGIAFDVMTG